MFDSVKIQVMLQTYMLLQNLPNYNNIFIYNEDVKDVQNLHGKNWETKEVQISNYQAASAIKVGFSNEYASELMFQASLIVAASEALKLRVKIYHFDLKNMAHIFENRQVDILLMTFEFSQWKTFLLPFVTLEIIFKFDELKEQYRGIYNGPKCEQIIKQLERVCDYDDIAVVWPLHQVDEDNIPCRLIKLTGVFPKLYGSIMIQNNFKYREHYNRMYIRMQTAGIVKRSHSRYKTSKLKKNYDAHEHYQVELEGVLFEHVKLIFMVYSLMFPLVLMVLAIEIIWNWKYSKGSSKIEPLAESISELDPSVYDFEIVEGSLEDLDLDEQHHDLNISIESSNPVIQDPVDDDNTDDLIMEFVEYLEVIDFE
ncbi:unnamed protein product [Diamesa hyperborea]